MRVIIAPDSFKESMSASLACQAIEDGLHRCDPSIECIKVPMADGGEGTMEALCEAIGGIIYMVDTVDVFRQPIKAPICLCKDSMIIESAKTIGLDLIPRLQRDIYEASTYGLGLLIKEALDKEVKKIMICLGGSATNDGGVGMLQALGVSFKDKHGQEITPNPKGLKNLESIDITNLDERIKETEILGVCDVDNVVCGKQGASYVFGPQKGATSEDCEQLDTYLQHFGVVSSKVLDRDILLIPGGGAAGGLGSALYGFLNARLESGISIVKELVKLEDKIKDADIVITGEGSFDSQTLHGKVCYGVASSAKKYQKPVFVFAGRIGVGAEQLYQHGVTAYFPIMQQITSLEIALRQGSENLTSAVENVFRAYSKR